MRHLPALLLAITLLDAAVTTACGSSRSNACQETPADVLAGISQGLNTQGVTITKSAAIPYALGLLVAGHLSGPGVDENTGWYVARINPTGSITSADGVAAEFSNWPLERIDLSEATTCL